MVHRSLSRVEELYLAALARPAAERDRFLDGACGGDQALLREVKSHARVCSPGLGVHFSF